MMRTEKKHIFFSAFFLFLLSLTAPVTGNPLENILEAAKDDYLDGELGDFSNKIDILLENEPDNPMVNVLWGLSLLQDEGIQNKINAKKLIEKNARRSSNDPFCNYALGLLYKAQNNPRSARKYFLKAVEEDDQLTAALIELGESYFEDMLRYYYRYSDTEIPLSFRRYAIEDYDFAVSYLRKALRYDPDNKRAAYLLGSLYYELREYQGMLALFKQMLEYYPKDKDLNLFLGLTHLAQHQYPDAYECFDIAIRKMSTAERQEILSPQYLVKDRKKIESSIMQEVYWKSKDPMFLTKENERLLEHFGRFAYVNLRFGVPKLNIEGWRTDRGKTYIRYGRPRYIIEYGKSMEFNAILPPMQIWIYSRFQLAFSDQFWNGLFQYTEPALDSKSIFKERTFVNYTLVAENVFATIPETFDFELPGGIFATSYQVKYFRERAKTVGYLSFAVPILEKLYYPQQDLATGLFVLNDDNLPQDSFEELIRLDYERESVHNFDNYTINHLRFYHKPGKYSYSFEILNKTLDMNFVDRREFEVPDFSADTLLISDIVLAHSVDLAADDDVFIRNGLKIIPNIEQIFYQEDTLYVYFEIYNLTPNNKGNVYYTVENAIINDGGGGLLKALFGKDERKVSIINEYSGQKLQDFVVQSIQLVNLDPKDYILEILVKDEVSGKRITHTTPIHIIKSLNN